MSKSDIKNPPWCPFCGQRVGRPREAEQRRLNEFPVGDCQCGAIYTSDATGHNVGSAMVEALVYACNDNWDFAWELLPEDDYLTGRIENYDEQRHEVFEKGHVDGRPVRGVLYFVRLHTEINEIAGRLKAKKESDIEISTVKKMIAEDRPALEPAPDEKRVKKKANKRLVKELVEQADVDSLVALCFDDKKTLRLMQRLLYDPYDEKRWHVAWMIGQVTGRVATREPGQVSELLHRLYEACNDSAATHWGMVETLGSVIAVRPDIFGAFTRHLLNFLGQDTSRVQVLWALGEIAETRPDLIRDTPFYNLFHFLQHPDAAVRGHVARLLGRINASEASMQIMTLSGDEEEFMMWEKGRMISTTVAKEAAGALAAIQGGLKKNDE
ncbi:DVU0298 family protein [Desulfosediminicola flagellatus]|uniref:DVU0298 family protein n=1 Tax=Desulfosediminicola flagellatus TaxID=2569541 RepID=UPI0010AB7D11|nr:DVU0298 family protein [Desulfosediminicola flagellatus]